MAISNKPTVLLVAEAVTLAHFGRIVTLAKTLDPSAYRVVVASDPRYKDLEQPFPCEFQPIRSIPSADFMRALAKGDPLYDFRTLCDYVEEDLALLDRVRPDLVVGDFRLSLAVSAPLRQAPYASVVNAYWSPYADIHYPVPDLPLTRLMGVDLGQWLFDRVRPLAFALHARPLNRVRRRYGQPSLGYDLRRVYSWADFTLYPDIPEMVPMRNAPANHRYLGPVLWSATTPLPDWWPDLPEDKPLVFVTLGSSGRAEILPQVVEALGGLPVTGVIATAGRTLAGDLPLNVHVADHLPMEAVVRRSRMLVCNGGSLTTYQALGCGVPVLGIAANMDQLLNMRAVEHMGAGICLRAVGADSASMRTAVGALLDDPTFSEAAARSARVLQGYDSAQRFREVVAGIIG